MIGKLRWAKSKRWGGVSVNLNEEDTDTSGALSLWGNQLGPDWGRRDMCNTIKHVPPYLLSRGERVYRGCNTQRERKKKE